MEGWKGGRVEGWKSGRMEGWKTWKDGRVEGWKDAVPQGRAKVAQQFIAGKGRKNGTVPTGTIGPFLLLVSPRRRVSENFVCGSQPEIKDGSDQEERARRAGPKSSKPKPRPKAKASTISASP
jgi:hypothetical protein